MTAARGLYECLVYVSVLLEEVVARHRHSLHRVKFVRLVGSLHRTLPQIVEQLVHHQLDFADHHGVGMLQRFLRHETRVHAAHHDRHAFGAELVGDFIATVDVTRHRGNPDQVRLQIEVDRLDVLVGEHDFVLVAWNGRGDGEQAGERGIERSIQVNRAGRQRIGFRIDEMNDASAHRNSPGAAALLKRRGRQEVPTFSAPNQTPGGQAAERPILVIAPNHAVILANARIQAATTASGLGAPAAPIGRFWHRTPRLGPSWIPAFASLSRG